jgi:GT2 family glycosyltransferase
MYFEETDFCYRAHKSGVRITYVPHAVIVHYGGESSRIGNADIISETAWSYFYPSQYYFFTKNYGLPAMLAIRFSDLAYGIYLLFRSAMRVDIKKRGDDSCLGRFMVKMALTSSSS